jgi:hypothetical protein
MAKDGANKQNLVGGGDAPSSPEIPKFGVANTATPQPSPLTNSILPDTHDKQPEPLRQEQPPAPMGLSRREPTPVPVGIPGLSQPEETPAPAAVPGLSFDSSQLPNPVSRVSEGAGKPGKDFRWGDYTYEVSPRDWAGLNNERKVFNAECSHIGKLSVKILAVENQMNNAGWLERGRLTKLDASLMKEWTKLDAERNAEGSKIDGMISTAVIKVN